MFSSLTGAQFSCTIAYIESLREYYADVIERFVGAYLNHTNSFHNTSRVAVLAAGTDCVTTTARRCVTDPAFFFALSTGMTFEQFVRDFADWFSEKRPAAMLVGIRSDEIL